jgi:hypothetical protein
MTRSPLPFFAILDSGVAVIRLAQPVQRELTEMFSEQRNAFVGELVKYDGRYTPDDGELLYVDDFDAPESITGALASPTGVDALPFDEETLARIHGIFTGVWNAQQKWIALQAFDRRKIISTKGFSLIHAAGTFVRLEEPGITLDRRLTAVLERERLLFHSFNAARRLFDLTMYFHEATDLDLRGLATHARIHIGDVDKFIAGADSWTRRKVALIAEGTVLDRPARAIARIAAGYGVKLIIRKIDGEEKIDLPADKQEMKAVLRVLDEDYFTSAITKRHFVTNSKRAVT